MKKSLFTLLLAIVVCLSNITAVFANEFQTALEQEMPVSEFRFDAESNDDSAEVNIGDERNRAFIHLVAAGTIVGKTGITINVGHAAMGTFDLLDSVKIQVKSNLHASQSTTLLNVSGIRSHTFSFPLTACMQEFDIVIDIKEGTQTRQLTMKASYGFSEASLAAGGWNAGTYSSRQHSVNDHYNRHHNDTYVKVTNVEDYLNQASALHNQILYDNSRGNLSGYNVVYNATNTKFTSKTSKRYALLTTNLNEIYSYGGN